MQEIIIEKGTYQKQPIDGTRCKLVNPPKFGARGWYANVIIPAMGTVRIHLESEKSYKVLDAKGEITKIEEAIEQTEEEVILRIKERFDIFDLSINGIINGDIRAMIVSGAAGIGKTETVLRNFEKIEAAHVNYECIRGNIVSAFQLYQLLWDNNGEDKVLILDDCDAILKDITALNILKAALESGDRPRFLHYQSNAMINQGIPPKFEYTGRMIFITNEDFQRIIERDKSQLARHFKAVVDRTMYLDLMLHSRREVYCRIKQMVGEGILDFTQIEKKFYDEILFWIKGNLETVRSLSLRTAIHVAEMIKTNPDNWQRMSNAFLLKNGF